MGLQRENHARVYPKGGTNQSYPTVAGRIGSRSWMKSQGSLRRDGSAGSIVTNLVFVALLPHFVGVVLRPNWILRGRQYRGAVLLSSQSS